MADFFNLMVTHEFLIGKKQKFGHRFHGISQVDYTFNNSRSYIPQFCD